MRQRSSQLLIGVTAAVAAMTGFLLAATPQVRALDSIDIRVGAVPVPVLGSDGRTHFAYELHITETSGTRDIGLDRLEVFGERMAKPLLSYDANALEERVMRPGAERRIRYGRVVRRGTTAVVHLWVTLPNGAAVPGILRSRVAMSHDGVAIVGAHRHVRASRPKTPRAASTHRARHAWVSWMAKTSWHMVDHDRL